jgi:hypothetical protein
VPLWARAILAIAGAKTTLGIIAYLSGVVAAPAAGVVAGSVYALLASTYTLLGGGLIVANRGDVRAEWLGGLFVLIGMTLAPVVNNMPPAVPAWIVYLRPEAFLAAFLWRFVLVFPSGIRAGAARATAIMAAVTALAAVACVVINLSVVLLPAAGGSDWRSPWLFLTTSGNWYWPLVLGLSLPAYPVVLMRGRTAKADERRRVQRFLWCLLAGFAPIAVEVLVEELWPAYKALIGQPTIKPWVALALFGPLATVPFTTAYAVLVDAVVDMRIVLRSALQYALARYTILGLTLVPFAALAIFVVSHREEPLIALMSGPRPLLLGSAATLGVISMSRRNLWLLAVDRRHFRDAYDAQRILTRFVAGLSSQSSEDIAGQLRGELETSLHAEAAVFLANDAGTSLRDVASRWAPLAVDTPLVGLVLGADHPMDVDVRPGSTLGRLSEHERRWLAQGPFALVAGIRRANGAAGGIVALGAKRSGLPYSVRDRYLVSALGAAAGLALDNLWLRTPHLSPSDPAARECLECSRLNPSDAPACTCGGAVVEAAAPHLLRGIFRLEQRIGAGGMGVVYRATDLSLGRLVAIKTLPRVDEMGAVRLRREARAMASVTHPNLAVIYGLETWQSTPFLVEEYLGGGTLSARLTSGPISAREAVDLGCTLAAVLAELHATGIVHCDIKPSNIGFTSSGVVKLLDFGLSRLLRGTRAAPEDATTRSPSIDERAAASLTGAWRGTPFYMSPEAALGERPTAAFDLWALSVVLFEAVAGRRPFDGANAAEVFEGLKKPRVDIRTLRADCPAGLAAFFERALALEIGRRPATAVRLGETLASLRTGG